ncbi:15718_t:CDS:2 [Dentiscutata erythropus]|uniref:15718_t:CDS:1 n=1 Tax=Dentiscutata erythropus TaxID=1348616 RepID=A0A9N9HI73_9GLOM|nr:15718_t:CDS:2 [Dentiscutata erythropus]
MNDDDSSNNEDIIADDHASFSSQFVVTFERNKHGEILSDHMIDNDDMDNEDLFILEEQNSTSGSEYEQSSEKTHKRTRKNRVGGRAK